MGTPIDYGVPPIFFAGKSELSRYEFVPPLLHYFHYDELADTSVNFWGPLMWQHSKDTDAFNILPLFWHNWGKNEEHVTVLPPPSGPSLGCTLVTAGTAK